MYINQRLRVDIVESEHGFLATCPVLGIWAEAATRLDAHIAVRNKARAKVREIEERITPEDSEAVARGGVICDTAHLEEARP